MTTEHSHPRGHRIGHARQFLAVAFVLERLADVAMIWFTFQPACTSSILRGLALGSFFWTAAMLAGVWRRLRWARYVLTTFTWGYVAVFAFAVLQNWASIAAHPAGPYLAAIAGVLLYTAANAILSKSRRVRHYANG